MNSEDNHGIIPASAAPVEIIARPMAPLPLRPSDTYNWEQAMRVLRKNRRFALLFSLFVTGVVTVTAFTMKDVYQPTARVELDPPSFGIFTRLGDIGSTPENSQDYQETQAQILQSEALAMNVIRTLQLNRNPAVVGKENLAKFGHEAARKPLDPGAGGGTRQAYQDEEELADRTTLESIALGVFQKQLGVNNVRNSRLIEVSYTSHNPRLSQQIVNTLVSSFIDRNYKTRYATTMQTSRWLTSQMEDVREKVTTSTQALVDYQKKYGLVESEEKDLATTQNFIDANHRWSESKADRLQLEAYVHMLDAGQGESLPQVRDNQLHMTLTSRYVESRAQLAQARAIYGDENPNVKKLQDETTELAAQLDADREQIAKQLRTAYSAGVAKEESLRVARDAVRVQMGDVGERMVQYRILKTEAFANNELYRALSGRLKEAAITAGLGGNNIRVVDSAALLSSPSGPQRSLIIALGALISGLFGIALAFVKETLNNTVRTPDDIKDWTGLPSLAMVPPIARELDSAGLLLTPLFDKKTRAALVRRLPSAQSRTVEAEAMRELRTALMLSRPGAPPQVILVASSAPGEGKTTVAVNLAIAFAQRGKTCLVDGDLRRPMISNMFGLPPSTIGLSHTLAGSQPLDKALLQVPELPSLSLLPVGILPPNPADLVASDQMRTVIEALRHKFDHVVIDSPPSIPFADARILSSLVDSVVLVGRCGLTTRRAIMRCTQLLDEVRAPITGVVVNGIDISSADYHYYNYGFSSELKDGYAYRGYYGSRNGEPPPPSSTKPKAKGAHA